MNDEGTRLNKFLASCGVGSRRGCDKLIQDGLVVVNGSVCTNPATRVTDDDFVKVGGKRVQSLKEESIIINKPRGLVCSKNDELDRDTIYSLIPPKYQHLNHVGRLDKESEGLLILTNDGNLAQNLTHPTKKIEKEYLVTVDQAFDNDVLVLFLKGVHTPEGKAVAKAVKRLSPRRVRIILETGLKRQIRLMFQAMHLQVKKLVRIRIGNLYCDDLEPGEHRRLEQEDIEDLFAPPLVDQKTQHLNRTKPEEARRAGRKIKQNPGYLGDKKKSGTSNKPNSRRKQTGGRSSSSSSSGPRRSSSSSGGPRSSSSSSARGNGSQTGRPRSTKRSMPKRNASRRRR